MICFKTFANFFSTDTNYRVMRVQYKSGQCNRDRLHLFQNQKVDSKVRKEFEEAVDQAEEILRRRAFPKEDVFLDHIGD